MSEYVKVLERVLIFGDRIKAIEKKQAERFPMLVEKLNKLENDLESVVFISRFSEEKLNKLEDDLSKLTKTVYNIKKWTS
jgi:archaellum component FlaC